MVLIALLLLSIATAQNCPYCQWDACTITNTGFANCSACSYGALSTMEVYSPSQGVELPQIVGVCQPCPVGCSSCAFATLCPAMSPCFLAMNCTQCQSLYTYNMDNGGCTPCPANCLTCTVGSDAYDMVCYTCANGYSLNSSSPSPFASCNACPLNCASCQCTQSSCTSLTCTACASGYSMSSFNSNDTTCYATSTVQLQTGEEGNSSGSGPVIGLSIWGAVMSVLAITFIVLYIRQRGESAKPSALLSSENEPRTVSF